MANKVQKFREEVEKLKSQLLRGACSSQVAMETRCKEEAYNEVLAVLDTMQEEPVSEDLDDAIKYGKKIVLAELERIVKEKEEAGKNYVFVFSEVKDLVEKMSQKG